ncbi:Nn.00g085930.m01.CDS01 [Neocucurbitaria sp. VM-36]
MRLTTDRPMINIAKVSEWLTKNANEQLYPRLFLMSPNGTLLAYSKPVDIKELRDQAALISMVWKDNCNGRQKINARSDATQNSTLKPALKTLTIETEDCNIIVRLLQPELLLILVGKLPPRKRQTFKITAEGSGDPRYPETETSLSRPNSSSKLYQGDAAADVPTSPTGEGGVKSKAPSLISTLSQREKDIKVGTLHVQRKRLDALVNYILKDFEDTGFVMPADSDLQ